MPLFCLCLGLTSVVKPSDKRVPLFCCSRTCVALFCLGLTSVVKASDKLARLCQTSFKYNGTELCYEIFHRKVYFSKNDRCKYYGTEPSYEILYGKVSFFRIMTVACSEPVAGVKREGRGQEGWRRDLVCHNVRLFLLRCQTTTSHK